MTSTLEEENDGVNAGREEEPCNDARSDMVVSAAGLVLAVVLIVFGVYFNDRYQFANNNVRHQLVEQKVSFPPKAQVSEEELAQPGVVKYAGQAVDDGDKAQVYANEFIGLHLKSIGEGTEYQGKTYAELGEPVFALQVELAAAKESGDTARPRRSKPSSTSSAASGTPSSRARRCVVCC